ncbi:MAG TPA: diguanylate cyclase [Bacillota bacterium]
MTRERFLRVYIGTVVACGAAALGYTAAVVPIKDVAGVIFFFIAAGATALMPVALAKNSTINVGFALTFAAILLFGVPGGTWIAMAGALAGSLYPKVFKLDKLLFNVGSVALSGFLAGLVNELALDYLAGAPFYVVRYVAVPLVYFLSNSAFASFVISLVRNEAALRIWFDKYRWLAPNYLLLAPFGAAFAQVYLGTGLLGVTVFLPPLLMARYSFQLYTEKTKEVEQSLQKVKEHAAVIESKNVELNRRIGELSALHKSATAIGSTLNLHELLDLIIDLSAKTIGFSIGFLMLIQGDTNRVSFEIVRGFDEGDDAGYLDREACLEAALHTARTQQLYTLSPIDKVISIRHYRENRTPEDTLVFVPLVVNGSTLGVMGLTCSQESLKQQEDVLSIFASQAAAAIANAKLYESTEQAVVTDGITGLYNHRHFQELLDTELERARTQNYPVSLLLVDTDYFKVINDSYGHPVGDELLREMAGAIRSCLRTTDLTCRYGGDEFAVILSGADVHTAGEIADKIRRTIANRHFIVADGIPVSTTVSIGVSTFPKNATEKKALIDLAGRAAYHAKEHGRNLVSAIEAVQNQNEVPAGLSVTRALDPESYLGMMNTAYIDTIRALSYLVNAKDPYTYGHSCRVESYVVKISRALGLPEEDTRNIQRAALLHDIGKVGIDEGILRKEGPLTRLEYEVMKQHPQIGAQILERVDFLKELAPLVYHHQEMYDGGGYPSGLKGTDIPLGARIIAVADAYEAMTNNRPYRQRRTPAQALEELRKCSGKQFDPEIVEAFVKIVAPELVEVEGVEVATG